MNANSNAHSSTYDGVDIGGERLTHEIEQKIEELSTTGGHVRKLSIVGFSLGGLIARYAIGLMYQTGVFKSIEPVNFTTFATPHLGCSSSIPGWRRNLFDTLGSQRLSTSGRQLFLVDNFRDTGRPLLSVLADPKSTFVSGLALFQRRSLYANICNDYGVPYFTAAISRLNPFEDLRESELRYLPDQASPVILDTTQWSLDDRIGAREGRARFWNDVPTYAALAVLLPLCLPPLLVISVYQTYRSEQRLRRHEGGLAGLPLDRYRTGLAKDTATAHDSLKADMQQEPGLAAYLLPTLPLSPGSPSSPTSSQATKDDLPKLTAEKVCQQTCLSSLKLTPERIEMCNNLNQLEFLKFPVRIRKSQHAHAAIIARSPKESHSEGKVVRAHWAERFET